MQTLLRWILGAVALYVTVYAGHFLNLRYPQANLQFHIAPGFAGVQAVLLFVLALSLANLVIRPILNGLAMPLTCLTLGLFSFVINAFLFWLVGQFIPGGGFKVSGWQAPLFGSVVMSVIGGILNNVMVSQLERSRERGRGRRR